MPLETEQLKEIVGKALEAYYDRRITKLHDLQLNKVLKRKNPYLFLAAGITSPHEFIELVVSAFISSSEETIFGDYFFEPVALQISGGRKSITDSVDVEIESKNEVKAYAIKSGQYVFNAQSRRRQNDAFEECRRRVTGKRHFEPIVGYCYGRKNAMPKGKKNFREVSGQAFWEELSNDDKMYFRIADVVSERAPDFLDEYQKAYDELVFRFTEEFSKEYCNNEGEIDWYKLILFNSGKKTKKKTAPKKKTKKAK